jgi:hypothetical protein
MNDIAKNVIKTILPYLVCFLMGVLLAWKGCGDSSGKTVTQTIEVEKPVYITKYVDRWKTDTVRFVDTRIVTVYDTITNEVIYRDTVFNVDTVSIVEAWLTEVNLYDTLVVFDNKSSVNLKWQNYQNISEGLFVSYSYRKSVPTTLSLGIHANAGLLTDFDKSYTPLFGVGLQGTIKKTYIGLDYGYNSEHYIGLRVGRLLISK